MLWFSVSHITRIINTCLICQWSVHGEHSLKELRILQTPSKSSVNEVGVWHRWYTENRFLYLLCYQSKPQSPLLKLIRSIGYTCSSFYATHSICASHLILSIHSLAAELGSDPRFLLSNVEISRVMARSGSIKNEIIVEVKVDCEDSGDNSIELYPLTGARKSESGS